MNAADFLHELYDDVWTGALELTYIAPEGSKLYPNVVVQWADLPLPEIDPDMPIIRDMNARGYSVYFGVAVRRERIPSEQRTGKSGNAYTFYPRGHATDAAYVTALWVDIDDGSPEAYQRLLGLNPWPNIVVRSGKGIHGYWRLNMPLVITDDNRSSVKRTLKGLALAVGGDTACADLARVMRLPDTTNTKPGRNNALCEIINTSPGRYRYQEIERHYSPLGGPREVELLRSVAPEASLGLPKWVQDYLTSGALEGGRNRRLFAAAVEYHSNGLPQHQAEAELGARARLDGLDDDEIIAAIASGYRHQGSPNISAATHAKMAISDRLNRQKRW